MAGTHIAIAACAPDVMSGGVKGSGAVNFMLLQVMQYIFDIFSYIATLPPFNIWPWLFLLVIPLLVFSASPQSTTKILIGRVLLAMFLGHMLLNFSGFHWRGGQQQEYESCHAMYDNTIDAADNCHRNGTGIVDGLLFYLGWVLAAVYVDVFERRWRKKHTSSLVDAGKVYLFLSYLLTNCSFIVWVFVGVFVAYLAGGGLIAILASTHI